MTSPGPGPIPPPRVSYGARLAFACYLICELLVLYAVFAAVGLGWTVLLLIGTTALGVGMVGGIGTKAARQYREAVNAGQPPGPKAISGTIGVIGAILLILPGFITDVVGLLCVFPPTRFLWRSLVTRFLRQRLDSPSLSLLFGPRVVRSEWGKPDARRTDGEFIEGEVVNGDNDTGDGSRDETGDDGDDDGPRPIDRGPS